MKNKRLTIIICVAVLCTLIVVGLSACGGAADDEPAPTPTPEETPTPTPSPPTPEPSPEPVILVEWPEDGVVEHLFFHEIIAFPELAFSGGHGQKGFDDFMVTVSEFNLILESLYNNNYILVNLNDVWSEFTNDNDNLRMRRNTLMLPEGKKPIVISFDDLSFYAYMEGEGFMERYVIGSDGEVWAEGYDPDGNRIVSQEHAAITVLDRFIRENPDFSHEGAKGCIALTGYEGILGYRTQSGGDDASDEFRLNRRQEIARVEPVVSKLKETGWYFASHSYGHIRNSTMSLTGIQNDAERWMDEVGSLVGETKIYIFAHGERLDGCDWRCQTACGPGLRFYVDLGFRLFAAVGSNPFTHIKPDIAAVVMDRMAVDGIALRFGRDRYDRFFDRREVFDNSRPAEYAAEWDLPDDSDAPDDPDD